MADIVRLPKLGLSDRGEILEWTVSPGDSVDENETIAILESDKSSVDIEAPTDGVFLGTYVDVGDEIEIDPGKPIAAIGQAGESMPDLEKETGETEMSDEKPEASDDDSVGRPSAAETETRVTPKARVVAAEHDVDPDAVPPTGPDGSVTATDVEQYVEAAGQPSDSEASGASDDGAVAAGEEDGAEPAGGEGAAEADGVDDGSPTGVKATPKAKKAAREEGVDLSGIDGTGPQGAITAADVRRHVDEGGATDARHPERPTQGTDFAESDPSVTVSSVRDRSRLERTMADRLTQSVQEKPHARGNRVVNVERLEQMATELSGGEGDDISVNDLLVLAVVRTLQEHPEFNAVYTEDEHRLIEEVNVGYAVDSPGGLVVPVIEQAGEYSLAELARERQSLVDTVLDGEYDPADLQGGTFTVSNVGVLGMDSAFSIIDPPQVAILAVGRRRPELFESGDEIVTATGVQLSLMIDHRVLDGADAGRFLRTLATYVEQPSKLLHECGD